MRIKYLSLFFFVESKSAKLIHTATSYGCVVAHKKKIYAVRVSHKAVEICTAKVGLGGKIREIDKERSNIELPYEVADDGFTMAVLKGNLCVCSTKTPVIYCIKLSEIPKGQFLPFFVVPNDHNGSPPAGVYICGAVDKKLLVSIASQRRFLLIDHRGSPSQVIFDIGDIQGRAAAVHNDALYIADCRPSEGKYYVRKFEQPAKEDTKL